MIVARPLLAAVALLGLAACGADEPTALELPPVQQGDASLATTTAAPVVSAPPSTATAPVGFSVPAVAGREPVVTGDSLGSGCQGLPEDSLPDGLFAVEITQRGAELTVDLGCLGTDGVFVNERRTSRTNPIAGDLVVFELVDAVPVVADAAAWLTEPATAGAYWVAVNGGTVTSVQRITAP